MGATVIPYGEGEWCGCGRCFIPQTPMARMWEDRLEGEARERVWRGLVDDLTAGIDREAVEWIGDVREEGAP